MTPSNPQEQYAREMRAAEGARALLDNPTFKLVIARIRADTIDAWASTSPQEAEDREAHYQMLRALDRLHREIEAVAAGGKIAAHNLRRVLGHIGG